MATKRVLVVDDEPEVAFALNAYFLNKGYEMLTALDGLAAMRALRQHAIDLVLLDLKMPGVNGVEVLKFIHAQSPGTKVIVVTAYDDQFREVVEKLGVDGFLIKPFGIEALTRTVEEALEGRAKIQPPIREVPRLDQGPRPRARLLFVEPSEYTYQLKEVFFGSPEKAGGEYEVACATSTEEAQEKIRSFKPDILLVDLAMLGLAGDLVLKAMAMPERPKELIIHGSKPGLPAKQSVEVDDLSERGVKMVFNESFTQAGLARLGEVIRKAALELQEKARKA
ncbi:MAG: response regulator [Candidatus Omnitrophica bacterium]|nr:response regulator [Candidatus Omnitrophota bacterium]